MAKVKITVVKKLDYRELFGDQPPVHPLNSPVCDRLEVGQEFICQRGTYPEGFCAWAYADIQRDIVHLLYGGDFPWMQEKGAQLACCTDGVRPVIFKLERIED